MSSKHHAVPRQFALVELLEASCIRVEIEIDPVVDGAFEPLIGAAMGPPVAPGQLREKLLAIEEDLDREAILNVCVCAALL